VQKDDLVRRQEQDHPRDFVGIGHAGQRVFAVRRVVILILPAGTFDHLGLGRSGHDGIDPDAEGPEFDRGAFGQPANANLDAE